MWSLENFLFDLSALNKKIKKYDIPIKSNALNLLESDLEGRQHNEPISHIVNDIEFELREKISGTIPIEVSEFSFYISINFITDNEKDFETQDPFYNDKIKFKDKDVDSYSLQLEINGESESSSFTNSWHLDRHITGGGNTKFTHPFYHFQNGGRKLEAFNDLTGNLLITAAPRLPHPPMDVFLAFHFVITNFYNRNSSENIKNLLEDDDYKGIIQRAQKRMWKPYYNAYNGGVHSDYTINNITPLYTVH